MYLGMKCWQWPHHGAKYATTDGWSRRRNRASNWSGFREYSLFKLVGSRFFLLPPCPGNCNKAPDWTERKLDLEMLLVLALAASIKVDCICHMMLLTNNTIAMHETTRRNQPGRVMRLFIRIVLLLFLLLLLARIL